MFSDQGRWQRKVLVFLLILGAMGWLFPGLCQAEEPEDPASAVPLTFETTFGDMGYDEKILESPLGQDEYAFRLPESWWVGRGSYLDLEFSYFFTELEQKKDRELRSFGELSVRVDGSLLAVYALDAAMLERERLRVDLSPALLNERPGQRHEIDVTLNAWFLCDTAHRGSLVIHPESALFINYTLMLLELDLAKYPSPFLQRSFNLDRVQFVMPVQPSTAEVRTAAVAAAGLSDLAGRDMVISATTDVDLLRLVESGQVASDHLFVIGRPDRNKLIPWLADNEAIALPVSMHLRELVLSTEGPRVVVPGDVFTYVIGVTNMTYARVQDFILIDYLPSLSDLMSCHPECVEDTMVDRAREEDSLGEAYSKHKVSWPLPTLSPGEQASFSLMLKLTETLYLSSTLSRLETMVALADGAQNLVNVRSLSAMVESESADIPLPLRERVVSSVESRYFFTRDGQPVSEEDGVLQEILSPWDPQKAVLLITGLGDETVHKAAQALNLETNLLDMEGPSALIYKIQPSPPVTETWLSEFTFADIGYRDRFVYGIYPHSAKLDYWFDVPRGWHYTNEAYLNLRFDHSEAIDIQNSMLTILLNGSPVATVPLTQTNAAESLQVDLPSTDIRAGATNMLSIHPVMYSRSGVECRNFDVGQAWLRVYQDSWLHLGQRVESVDVLADLDYFPFPFDNRPDLSNVLFVLPPNPSPVELEALFQIVSILGRNTRNVNTNPRVSLGKPLDATTLRDYHVVAIGRPTRNSLIQEINDSLPQPFIPGTDAVENWIGEVTLRLPPDVTLGYVQELQSPWNEALLLLVVTGTQDEGVAWAASALNRQSWRFDGNLALVRKGEEGIDVRSFDTRRLTSGGQASTLLTAVPELTPVSTPTVTPTLEIVDSSVITPSPASLSPGEVELPVWVMLFIGVTLVVMVIIFVVGIWRFQSRKV